MTEYKSDIPDNAVERSVSTYRSEGGRTSLEKRECTVEGEIVGYRYYDENGTLTIETPVRDGVKHGMEYSWDDGCLNLAEPYENGLVHGTARQWADDGSLMGTYTLDRGTGYDLWRQQLKGQRLHVCEIHTMKDGYPHGFEWWVNEDQRTVYHEMHWRDGRHGIERQWDDEGNLDPGFPRFHLQDTVVDRETYMERQKSDATLPPYAAEDDKNTRTFPDDAIAAIAAIEKS